MRKAKLKKTCLFKADLLRANLSKADLEEADLREAILRQANLSEACLYRAKLQGAELTSAILVETNLKNTNLTGSYVYGIAAWNPKLEGAIQSNLVVTPKDEPNRIMVSDIEVAQLVYVLINYEKLGKVLAAIAQRGVLILGRFNEGGLKLLEAIATKLRELEYQPIIFNFDRPADRNYTETVKTLVGLSRFVVVDLSGPSVPLELQATVPDFKIPFVPILEKGRRSPSLVVDILMHPWVVKPIVEFTSVEELIAKMRSRVVDPAEEKHRERQLLLNQLFPE